MTSYVIMNSRNGRFYYDPETDEYVTDNMHSPHIYEVEHTIKLGKRTKE